MTPTVHEVCDARGRVIRVRVMPAIDAHALTTIILESDERIELDLTADELSAFYSALCIHYGDV